MVINKRVLKLKNHSGWSSGTNIFIDKNSRDNCGHVEVSNSRILIDRQTIKTLKELM